MKSKIKLIIFITLLLFGLTFIKGKKISPRNRLNIILLMADDMGWGDTGYNGNKIIRTPNLDRMAMEGIRFNRFYSASAVCSPTRASVLTGRNPYRMGVFSANKGILRPEEITLPELLKAQGYTTGHFGKWHLGTLTHTAKEANRGRPGNFKDYNPPRLHGYDVAFVTEAKVPTYDPMKKPVKRKDGKGWDYQKEGESYVPYGTYYHDITGKIVTDNLIGDDSRIIMDRVLPFIKNAKINKKPFLAVVWFHAPHKPFISGPEYWEMYKEQNEKMRDYAGCITALDTQVGRLRNFLENENLAKNTMIWFCSDNGPEKNSPGNTGGFRERKRSLHEGGVRVPGLLVWPKKIKKPFVTEFPAVTSDYLPTIMDILNIDRSVIPYQLDGISLLPLINGKMSHRSHPIGFALNNQCVVNSDTFKLYSKEGIFSLYNIVSDPYEEEDLILHYPDLTGKLKINMVNWLNSCRKSFEGDEYGKESFNRMKQKWSDPLRSSGSNKKKTKDDN